MIMVGVILLEILFLLLDKYPLASPGEQILRLSTVNLGREGGAPEVGIKWTKLKMVGLSWTSKCWQLHLPGQDILLVALALVLLPDNVPFFIILMVPVVASIYN
jgi:hypothetical protein